MECVVENNENNLKYEGNLENFLMKKKMKIGFENEFIIKNVKKEENPEERMKFLFPSLTSEVRILIFNIF